jgi:prophage tail gpP-like protein
MSRIVVKNATTGAELIWRHIIIKKSLDDICHTLEMEIAPCEREKVRRHNKIEVRYENPLVKDSQAAGGRRVTTVLVDEVTGSADSQKHGITVTGRSPARDIIDSTWSEDFADMTVLDLAKTIGKRFGIQCHALPPSIAGKMQTIYAFRIQNESPWVKLINEADNEGYILTSNEAGDLYFWEVSAAVRIEDFKLVEGVNIKSIEWTENGAEQFHEYIVEGCYGKAVVIDDACPGGRILTMDITDPDFPEAKLQRRAETEMRRRRETRVTATVPGWGLTDEQITRLGSVTAGKEIFWVPNLLIPVIAPSMGLDAKLLIAEVEQEATPEAFESKITVVKREAYL